MNVLVVGGAGYVGGAVTDRLSQSKHTVRVFDGLLYEEAYRKPVDFVYGDIRDHAVLLPQLKWADCVVWLAALVGDAACDLDPKLTKIVNQDSVQWLARHFNGRIIFMSTCSVYGAQNGDHNETSPTDPLSVYSATKLQAEPYLKDKNAIIFRLGTLFGVSDTYARIRLDLILNTLAMKAYTDHTLHILGGQQGRPLLHVRDAAQAIVDNLATDHRGIFNLHTENIRIIDLAKKVQKHFPGTSIEVKEVSLVDTRNYRANSDKARKELGFKSRYSIDDGILQIKTLLVERRLRDVGNPRYSNEQYLKKYQALLQREVRK